LASTVVDAPPAARALGETEFHADGGLVKLATYAVRARKQIGVRLIGELT
jgi:hypothetical protein